MLDLRKVIYIALTLLCLWFLLGIALSAKATAACAEQSTLSYEACIVAATS